LTTLLSGGTVDKGFAKDGTGASAAVVEALSMSLVLGTAADSPAVGLAGDGSWDQAPSDELSSVATSRIR
jgi:hypothetical protein